MTRADVSRELRRFALYDCLLEANNTADASVFEAWARDALALELDLSAWAASGA